jgi:hypothetical protein
LLPSKEVVAGVIDANVDVTAIAAIAKIVINFFICLFSFFFVLID